jgi:mono/diheme cytochrome c family protein
VQTTTKLTVGSTTAGLILGLMALLAVSVPAAQQPKPQKSKSTAAATTAASGAATIALGKSVYDKQGCGNCHAIGGKGGSSGPDLTATGAAAGHTAAWFATQVTNPKAHNPNATMPAFPGVQGKDLTAIAVFLVSLKGTQTASAAPVDTSSHRGPAAKPDPVALAKVQKTGALVGPIAQNDDHLDVNFRMVGKSITDKDMAALPGLKSVVTLNLGQTGITDAGLVYLKGLKELEELHLEGTQITDAGLVNLRGLTNLTYLNLYGDNVSDAGLQQLTHLAKLRHLYIWQTKVTPAGADALKKQLPQLEIIGGWEDQPKK